MAWRGEVEDGLGWGGLVASKSEQREEARLAALERDAARWRHARRLFTIDDIEGAQGAHDSFGGMVSEDECIRADAAIDAAMTGK